MAPLKCSHKTMFLPCPSKLLPLGLAFNWALPWGIGLVLVVFFVIAIIAERRARRRAIGVLLRFMAEVVGLPAHVPQTMQKSIDRFANLIDPQDEPQREESTRALETVHCRLLDHVRSRNINTESLDRNIQHGAMTYPFEYALNRCAEGLHEIAEGHFLFLHEADYSRWQQGLLRSCQDGDYLFALCAEKTWAQALVSSWMDLNFECAGTEKRRGVRIERGFIGLWGQFSPEMERLLRQHQSATAAGQWISSWTIRPTNPRRDSAIKQIERVRSDINKAWQLNRFFGLVIFDRRIGSSPNLRRERSALVHWHKSAKFGGDPEMHGQVLISEDKVDELFKLYESLQRIRD